MFLNYAALVIFTMLYLTFFRKEYELYNAQLYDDIGNEIVMTEWCKDWEVSR